MVCQLVSYKVYNMTVSVVCFMAWINNLFNDIAKVFSQMPFFPRVMVRFLFSGNWVRRSWWFLILFSSHEIIHCMKLRTATLEMSVHMTVKALRSPSVAI